MVQPNSVRLNCYQSANGASTALTNANLTNTSLLFFTVCYGAA
jgi:hypothetical protein